MPSKALKIKPHKAGLREYWCVLKSHALKIHPSPKAHFTYTPKEFSSLYPKTQFWDPCSETLHWLWNFQDKKWTSVLPSPIYLNIDTGWFHVNLILTSDFGCVDS